MPPKPDQGVIIILDVGKNVSNPEEKEEKSFFEKAKECASRLIERKIMSQGNSLIGIILLGSKKTENNMASQYDNIFKYIEVYSELVVPTWEMIRKLPEHPSTKKGDWVEALVVAADYYKNVVSGFKLSEKKIILMTNFQSSTAMADNIDKILTGFKEENFEVDVIGPDIYSHEDKKMQFVLARQFVETTDGVTATFEHTMNYLLFHQKKAVKAVPWNVDLSIGPNIKIPVSAFLRITKDEPTIKWSKTVKDPVTAGASTTEAIVKNKQYVNPENQKIVESANKITGYTYGHKIIPFTECDKTMLYESGEKCLSVYGFTDARNINWQNFDAEGLSYVFGKKGDKKAQLAVRCLVECLHELNLIGIVKKVHNKNNAPRMFALMPVIDSNNFVCLSMAMLCYKDDIKQMYFPPTNLKKYQCNSEQVNAFKELIAAMDLTKAYDESFDDTEAFPTAETVSPTVQYMLDSIAYRAQNPGKPLPPPRDDIMTLFKVPPSIEKRAREPLEKIKKFFVLNKVEPKPKRMRKIDIDDDGQTSSLDMSSNDTTMPNLPKVQLPTVKADEISKITTIDPVGDFKALINKNKNLEVLTPEMIEAIESLIFSNIDGDYLKPIDAMMHLRNEYVKTDPSAYNSWLQKFKSELNNQKNNDVLDLIKAKKVDYILKAENSRSNFEDAYSHDDSQLYQNDTVPDSTELTIRSEINDMFDEM